MKNDFTKLSVDELEDLINDMQDEINARHRRETAKLFYEAISILTKLNEIDPYMYVVNCEGDMTYVRDLMNKENYSI